MRTFLSIPEWRKIVYNLFSDRFVVASFILFLIGLVLRLYEIGPYITFLGDQGRDAIIIRRILTFEHFPAIGAPTSIGQVYLGPFYYYFIAPWLLIFKYEPVGLAIGVAVLSSLFIPLSYYLVVRIFGNKLMGIVFAFLITFSLVLVDFSRFSWNPNLIPLFSFLIVALTLLAISNRSLLWSGVLGSILALSAQLHYIALILALPVTVVYLLEVLEKRITIRHFLKAFVSAGFFFGVFSIPLIIFDLRHQFINLNAFITLLTQSEAVVVDFWSQLLITSQNFFKYIFGESTWTSTSVFFIFACFLGVIAFWKDRNVRALLLFFCLSYLGIFLYQAPRHPHYFMVLYPLFFLIVAYMISRMNRWRWGIYVGALFLFTFLATNSSSYPFIKNTPNYQVEHARNVAETIREHTSGVPFQVASFRHQHPDSAYRYFLEVWGHRPLERDSLDRAEELFVICDGDCIIIGDSQWEISFFAPSEIVDSWEVEGLIVHKLIN